MPAPVQVLMSWPVAGKPLGEPSGPLSRILAWTGDMGGNQVSCGEDMTPLLLGCGRRRRASRSWRGLEMGSSQEPPEGVVRACVVLFSATWWKWKR